MWANIYVDEKLRELDRERLARIPLKEPPMREPRKAPPAGRLAAAVGRSLREMGEALELWATPTAEHEKSTIALARARKSHDYR
jgi:hypothetical protein